MQSTIRSRSNSASAPKMWNTNRPVEVVVSILSWSDLNPMTRSPRAATVSIRCFNERPRRSKRHTISVSPARAKSSAAAPAHDNSEPWLGTPRWPAASKVPDLKWAKYPAEPVERDRGQRRREDLHGRSVVRSGIHALHTRRTSAASLQIRMLLTLLRLCSSARYRHPTCVGLTTHRDPRAFHIGPNCLDTHCETVAFGVDQTHPGQAMSIHAATSRRALVAGAAIVAAVAAVTIGPDLGGHSGDDSVDNTAGPRHAQTRTIVIDSSVGETFRAAGSATIGAITASQARTDSVKDHGVRIPADATVRTGFLTMPVGPGFTPNADSSPVYAISWHSCGPHFEPLPALSSNGARTPTHTPAYVPRCTECTFVDATTGAVLDTTWS